MRKKLASVGLLILLAALIAAAPSTTTVYITRTGAKYHVDGCRSLSKSKIAISLGDAIAKGYAPCAVCKPPTLGER